MPTDRARKQTRAQRRESGILSADRSSRRYSDAAEVLPMPMPAQKRESRWRGSERATGAAICERSCSFAPRSRKRWERKCAWSALGSAGLTNFTPLAVQRRSPPLRARAARARRRLSRGCPNLRPPATDTATAPARTSRLSEVEARTYKMSSRPCYNCASQIWGSEMIAYTCRRTSRRPIGRSADVASQGEEGHRMSEAIVTNADGPQ